jgi:hypothetical protein
MLILLAFSRSEWLDDRLSHAIGWSAVGLLIVVMVGVYVFIIRASLDKAWRKVSFDLTDGEIVRVMESPKLVMSVFIFSWLLLLWLVYQRVS